MTRMEKDKGSTASVEWPTLALILACYGAWGAGTWAPLWVGLPAVCVAVALFSSLQHEALHGHPTRLAWVNTLLVSPALTVVVPYLRFRDTHLDHHRNPNLTDPYDDPESNYVDPKVWRQLPRAMRAVLVFNNTLLGRISLGPLIGTLAFLRDDMRRALSGDRRVAKGWLWHGPALIPVAILLYVAPMPVWAYMLAVYGGLSLIRIRTFLEHQAAASHLHRTAIIEDSGPLAWLFLNNNLHSVHHAYPAVPWYRLPALYATDRAGFQARNGGYLFRSYRDVFCRYFFQGKDPVVHPLKR